ncbi:uncharacterized protein LAESUDRAFT_764149 [Laetiporus sulphureus 93-53]|uniref:Uncharacterized protein n=1 Tax=Laetiporus sulphureus 93-53 TaxID=1314785 RepID=A0A165BF82_9APHY|nr:uncharacterized protein LAESUDRAFT_764149 [Laetiporus sulphureus 93-53]KZT00928.1 hypothetical protein LAESUDRAFT_764149 [Laetiporus sulphureus 93-53]
MSPTALDPRPQSSQQVLPEEYVQEAFHSFLKSSLTQAKIEGLLPTDVLSSAEGDLMITGPALCLYFAALRSTTEPPSVPLPRRSKSSSNPAFDLSYDNCPPTFRPFWLVWSQSVPEIQALVPEHQHDLARIICGLPPIATPINRRVNGIAADLRAVAIEISMRRTFQDRYANDLQAALDAGSPGGRRKLKASFVPPPDYNTAQSTPSISRTSSAMSSTSTIFPSPISPHSPTILGPDAPIIEFIRETLYAALADVIERTPSIRRALRTDPTRAYFAAVAFAILDVATGTVTHPHKTVEDILSPGDADREEATIHGVLGKTITLSECPRELRPFMAELCAIGKAAREMEEEDSLATVRALERGQDPPSPRLDRVHDVLEGGVGHAYDDACSQRSRRTDTSRSDRHVPDSRRRTTSTENRAVAFANRINALALGMTKLRAFRERQDMVFKVLSGIGG